MTHFDPRPNALEPCQSNDITYTTYLISLPRELDPLVEMSANKIAACQEPREHEPELPSWNHNTGMIQQDPGPGDTHS